MKSVGSEKSDGSPSARTAVYSAAGPRRCDWLHFTGRSGESGRDWAAAYARYGADLRNKAYHALSLLRRGELEPGKELLDKCAAELNSTPVISGSVRAVLERWYYGTAGYYHYCIGDFQRAHDCMQKASDAVADAISQEAFLVMLSVDCQEFCLHHARIARNQRHWDEMWQHIERGRKMLRDEVPLCNTGNGSGIYVSTVRDFIQSFQPLQPEEQRDVRWLLEDQERERSFDKFVRGMLQVPNLGIEY
ncbi:MAG: hypothetical protein JWM83_1925 [Candidatus Angelobacter sp.]|nr:hypothetical protein [Candidatus Angelobacter sp.]